MPTVSVEWLEGRSPEKKREIADFIMDTVADVAKVQTSRVAVLFNDYAECDIMKGKADNGK